jgi:hypothetical protein
MGSLLIRHLADEYRPALMTEGQRHCLTPMDMKKNIRYRGTDDLTSDDVELKEIKVNIHAAC